MRFFITILSLLALFPPCAGAAEKPNFIVIFIDDLGYGEIGPFGSTANETPNLDRMAAVPGSFPEPASSTIWSAKSASKRTSPPRTPKSSAG